MKFTIAPLVGLLFGASCLIANTTAYSYDDFNELDARQQIDDVLSERGLGLEARETVDVPFQPSLRAFLGEAVTAYRRSTNGYEENLDARGLLDLTIKNPVWDPHTGTNVDHPIYVTVSSTARVTILKDKVLRKLYEGFFLTYNGRKLDNEQALLSEIGVKSKDVLSFTM
ncbi:hypothetical protein D9611_012538 [Ephemerocybe angulata]|uniref:Uncharacterized protein n=1 Tax=Ephemerocybe angulata TaxID=980116 RepID=A0A8H5ET04_9AGAR|nr:hypothetical protein D9611_012538 [Tulosesus angulatus]